MVSEASDGERGRPILELSGIGKTFGGVTALTGVDFTLREGEVHGLIGENGAGKSTLMKIIAGVHAGYEGEMRLDGRPVHFRCARTRWPPASAWCTRSCRSCPALSVAENVFLGHQLDQRRRRRALAARWRARPRSISSAWASAIDPEAETGRLPLGLQQLVELGRVLFSGARIIILDEPTSALSPPEIERLFAVLRPAQGARAPASSSSRTSSRTCSRSPTG